MSKFARRPVFRRLSIGVVGIGMVTAAATGGVASAATTTDRVPGTSCNVAQVERALNAQDPALYTKIMSSSDARSGLESVLTVSKSERARRWSRSLPASSAHKNRTFLGVKGFSKDQRHAAEKSIESAVSNCSKY